MTPSFKLLDADSIESASKNKYTEIIKTKIHRYHDTNLQENLINQSVLFLMTACSDDKKELKIIVEPTSFHFEQTGGSRKFGITPNKVPPPMTQPLSKVRKHGAK